MQSSWNAKSVDHVLTYSGRIIAVGSQKPSRITRQKICCASESNTLVRIVFANRSGFVPSIGVLLSTWHGRSVDHVLTYFGRQMMVGSWKPSRITRQKSCCASESNTLVRVVLANHSGFDAPLGVVLAWEDCGSYLNIFRMTNRGRISETFTNYEAKHLLRNESNTSVRVVFVNRSGFEAPIAVDMAWEERGSCINIFRTGKSRLNLGNLHKLRGKSLVAQVSQKRRSQKPSRITRQKSCCASESNTSVCVVFANRGGFDAPIGVVLAWEDRGSYVNIFRMTNRAPIGVVLAWEEHGSCLKIFQTINHGRISENFTYYEAKDLLPNESNTSVRVVFANRSGFDAPIGWEERGSCLNIFRTRNHGRISETFTNFEAKDLLRYVHHVFTYSGRQITVGSQKSSRITRQKTCCLSETNTSVRVVFLNPRGFDAPIGVVLACEERGSCLNIFRMTNCGRISETFTNYEAKHLLRKSVDHVLTYSGRQIAIGSQKPSQITRQKTCCAMEERGSCINIFRTTNRGRISKPSRITRQKTCCASESNTFVRVVFANRNGFDAPIGVVLAWEERGSCLKIFRMTNRVVMAWEEFGSSLNIFWMTNHGRISETFTNYDAKDLLRRSVDHVLTYSRRQIAVGPQKPSRIRRQRTCCASESNTSVRVVLANRSGFDAPNGVVMHGRSVDHVLTYSGRQIAVRSQNPSPITRRKTCCARESNTSVRVVFANRSGFNAPIAVVFAWEERGSCLNIFRTTNHGQISETFTNYEAKDLLRKCVDNVLTYSGRQIVVESQKPSQITRQNTCCASEANTSVRVVLRTGVVLMVQLESSWHGRSVDHVLTYFGRKITFGS
ncbi:uncharacterized protein G2W53_041656 [Senna tora]|uniref:Uncharacterized protein n=1 Tax=Senna tora TaxID=362788 RepID=A0A834SHD3_9FABA|nr:uncharacterized protein G2W53_041656 [Senna tora]